MQLLCICFLGVFSERGRGGTWNTFPFVLMGQFKFFTSFDLFGAVILISSQTDMDNFKWFK